MKDLVSILVPISFFALIAIVVFFTLKYNYQIKKALIEKGEKLDLPKRKFPFLELGFSVLGIGLGLAVSVITQSFNLSDDSKDLLLGACVLFFGGLGLVSALLIRKRIEK